MFISLCLSHLSFIVMFLVLKFSYSPSFPTSLSCSHFPYFPLSLSISHFLLFLLSLSMSQFTFFLLSLSLTFFYFSHLSTFSSFRLSYMGKSEVSEGGWQSKVLWSEWAVWANARANERSERPSDPYKAPKSVCRGTPLLASFAPLSCPLD